MKKSDLEIKYEKKIKSLSKKEIDTLDAIFPVKWYTYMNKGVFKSKTFVFGQDANNGMLGLLTPLLQKQGLDPNMVMAIMNNRGGFGNEGG